MRQFLNKPSVKNTFTLLSGSLLAQIFTLAIYPLLTHLYSSEEFGVYGLFSAVLLTLAAISNGGYNSTIMLPESRSVAFNLFALCGIFVTGFSIVFLILILIIKNQISSYINTDTQLFLLLPLSLFLEGFYFSLSAVLNREAKYKALTSAKVLQAAITGITSIMIGYFFDKFHGGLIIGMICGQFFSFLFMLLSVKKFYSLREVSWKKIKDSAKVYKDFPKYGLSSSYLNTLSRQIPFFAIPAFFGSEILGHFTLAYKILSAPVAFIGSSVSMIYYQKAARSKISDSFQLKKLNKQLAFYFGALSVGPVLLIIFFGPEIFSFIFGEAYKESGQYARWIVAWVAMMYILNPLSFLIDIYGKLKFQFFYNVFLIFIRVIVSIVGGMLLNAESTIALYGLSGFAFSLFLFVWLMKLTPEHDISKTSNQTIPQ